MKVVSEEISSLEGVDKKAEELLVKVARLNQALQGVRVWAQDDQDTEGKISVSLTSFVPLNECDAEMNVLGFMHFRRIKSVYNLEPKTGCTVCGIAWKLLLPSLWIGTSFGLQSIPFAAASTW